ncbi:MAG: AAA family ATPase, partial [Mycoplasmataceae bacterium]|nr:AAA family ATPase [Mycoplasmataceae bacterium]
TNSRFIKEAQIETTNFSPASNLSMDSKFYRNNPHFEVGDVVIHINFGEGIVLDVNGDSIIIEFKNKDVGVKQLLKNHKSIEKVN